MIFIDIVGILINIFITSIIFLIVVLSKYKGLFIYIVVSLWLVIDYGCIESVMIILDEDEFFN